MKKFVTGSLVLVGLLAGCSSHKPATVTPIPAPAPAETAYVPPVTPAYVAPTTPPAVTDTTTAELPPLVTTSKPAVKTTHTTHPTHTAATAVAAKGTKYVVKKGDTLSKIAQKKYGTVKAVKKILAANPGLNPDLIKIGQTIILP